MNVSLLFRNIVCSLFVVSIGCANVEEGVMAPAVQVSGRILQPDGKKPAPGAVVIVRRDTALAAISGSGLGKQKNPPSTITDRNGSFMLAGLDSGGYIIECTDERGNAARIRVADVSPGQSPRSLPEDTLKRVGAIHGCIRFENGGNVRSVFVLAFGSDRFTQAADDGSFTLKNMAAGLYDLKVVSLLEEFKNGDIAAVAVASGDTAVIDTVTLAARNIYIPANVAISYDTMLQYSILTWDTSSARSLRNYHIYRRDKDSSDTYLNSPLDSGADLRNGFYIDTTVIESHRYEYRVAAETNYGTIGKKSRPMEIYAVPYLNAVDTLYPPDSIANVRCCDVTTNHHGEIAVVFCDTVRSPQKVYVVWYREDFSVRKVVVTIPGCTSGNFTVDNEDNIYLIPYDAFDISCNDIVMFDSSGRERYKMTASAWVGVVGVVFDDTLFLGGSSRAGKNLSLKMKSPFEFDTSLIFENDPKWSSYFKFLTDVAPNRVSYYDFNVETHNYTFTISDFSGKKILRQSSVFPGEQQFTYISDKRIALCSTYLGKVQVYTHR